VATQQCGHRSVGDGVEPGTPIELALGVSPNPGATHRISFALPRKTAVKLGVYDVLGRRVAVLAEGELPAGRYTREWDGRSRGGLQSPAGVYFYRLEAGRRSAPSAPSSSTEPLAESHGDGRAGASGPAVRLSARVLHRSGPRDRPPSGKAHQPTGLREALRAEAHEIEPGRERSADARRRIPAQRVPPRRQPLVQEDGREPARDVEHLEGDLRLAREIEAQRGRVAGRIGAG